MFIQSKELHQTLKENTKSKQFVLVRGVNFLDVTRQ